jgi:hypothetical protein
MQSKAKAPVLVKDPHGALRETLDIQARLRRSPYGMMAGALGIGFVLGGGLFTRLAARILGTGIRIGLMAALPILQREFVEALATSKLDTNKEKTNETA